MTWGGLAKSGNNALADENKALRDRLAKLTAKYNELLFAVELKHPDERRHETALRLIKQAQGAAESR